MNSHSAAGLNLMPMTATTVPLTQKDVIA